MGAKKRHHFVPQWLLRRFICPDRPKREQVWLIQPGQQPLRAHIKNVGAEGYFYGDPETGLEDLLAQADSRDAGLLRRIELGADLSGEQEALFRMCWLLCIRTRAVRHKFTQSSASLLNGLFSKLTDPANTADVRAWLDRCFDSCFDDEWDKLPEHIRLQAPKEAFRKAARDRVTVEETRTLLQGAGSYVREHTQMIPAIERGHHRGLRALIENSQYGQIPAAWKELEWRVERWPEASLCLGDSVVLGFRGNPVEFCLPAEQAPNPLGVCLPISPSTLLVGTRLGQTLPLDAVTINRASALHSHSMLIASRLPEEHSALSRLIGKQPGVIPNDEVERIVSDVVRKG